MKARSTGRNANMRARARRTTLAIIGLAGAAFALFGLRDMKSRGERTLTVAIAGYWGELLPPLQNSAYGNAVLLNEFEPLVRRGANGLIEPLAAKSWEVSPDRRMLRFMIDTSRRFSDGSRLTAADVKRSWEDGLRFRARAANRSVMDALYSVKGYGSFAKTGTLEGIHVISDDVLELEFNEPARVPLGYLSGARYAVYKMVRGRGIGTGPYMMREHQDRLILAPNPFYGGKEKRYGRITLTVVLPRDMPAALRASKVDAALFAEYANLPECKDPKRQPIQCIYTDDANHLALRVNGRPGRVLSDAKNRLAVQAIVHDYLESKGIPEALRNARFEYDPQSFLKLQAGRLPDTEARAIIAKGRQFESRLIDASRRKPLVVIGTNVEWLIDLLRGAGVTLSAVSGNVPFERAQEASYKTFDADLVYGNFSVYNGDPDGLYHLLGKYGAIATPMTERPRVVKLMEEGRHIVDPAALAPHYQKVARAILEEVPIIHLGFTSRAIVYNSGKTRVSESVLERTSHRLTVFEPR